jgi:membrane-associated phospholipid phosphatase
MKLFLFTLPSNVAGCFKGWRWLWHGVAILITIILVVSGFDWWYFRATASLRPWMFPAALIGFFVPLWLPLALWLFGVFVKRPRASVAAFAVAQAEIIGLLISSIYKAFTGRTHPMRHGTDDITRVFHFGFLRGGMFWGWPSSHTTIAFAMAFTLVTLFPKQRLLALVVIMYAAYIGLGISTTIHWFSDFAAGAIIGTLIGVVVGRSFRQIQTGADSAKPIR